MILAGEQIPTWKPHSHLSLPDKHEIGHMEGDLSVLDTSGPEVFFFLIIFNWETGWVQKQNTALI